MVVAQLRMGVYVTCVSVSLCLVATADLLEEGAVSRYLGDFGKVLA
jgi:hypothetical protein